MSTISSMGNMPRICSCGAYPVVEFLPHSVQWRVECPKCRKAGAATGHIDAAVTAWNYPEALLADMDALTPGTVAGMAAH